MKILAVGRRIGFKGWGVATVVLYVSSQRTATATAISGSGDEATWPYWVITYGVDLSKDEARATFPHLDAILELADLGYTPSPPWPPRP